MVSILDGEMPMMKGNVTVHDCDDSQHKATSIEELWHPYVMLYLGQCVAAVIATYLSLKHPLPFIYVMLLSGIVFVVVGVDPTYTAWGYSRSDFIFIGIFIKWLIVNVFATIPVVYLKHKAATISKKKVKVVGIFVYSILGSNIIWTLGMMSEGHVIVYLNRTCGVMLTIALIAHCVALCRGSQELFEVVGGNVYGFGTPFPWLCCYTVWNVVFIAKITIGGVLQDFLFWALMFALKYLDTGSKQPIEFYFAYARPVQLGTFIAFTEACGTFVPYFYESTTLKEHCHLPVNSHPFFFFVTSMNLLFSVVVVYWSVERLIKGAQPFVSKFDRSACAGRELLEDRNDDEEGKSSSSSGEDDE